MFNWTDIYWALVVCHALSCVVQITQWWALWACLGLVCFLSPALCQLGSILTISCLLLVSSRTWATPQPSRVSASVFPTLEHIIRIWTLICPHGYPLSCPLHHEDSFSRHSSLPCALDPLLCDSSACTAWLPSTGQSPLYFPLTLADRHPLVRSLLLWHVDV